MDFAAALDALKTVNLHRKPHTLSTAQGRVATIDGKEALLFSSNCYLGLAEEPGIVSRAREALSMYGTGSGGSRLVTGNTRLHLDLEKLLATFKGTESSLLFTSGYTANLGALSALADADSHIFSDELNHASIIDGCRLSRGKTVIYRHNDPEDLVIKIRAAQPRKGIIVTDGVFSMDGDIAPLPELVKIKEEYGLLLMVDDAHATGTLGASGRGSLEHFGLEAATVDVLMGTLSKAIPSEGGFICGSETLCDYLRNTARSFIYTTAPAPASVAAAIAGIEYIRDHPERVARLQNNARYFARRISELANLPQASLPTAGETPIIPVIIGEEGAAKRASEALLEAGIFVPCIRYPTVARGQARLRFTLMATHSAQDMDYVVERMRTLFL